MTRLNPDHLLTFAAVVQFGGISAAASARHLTQPAVSNQLKQLQDSVGEVLYRRKGRGIVLTSAGEALHRYARQVESALRETEAFAEGLRGLETGEVRVAASHTIAGYVLPPVLVAFRRRYPGVEVLVETQNSQQVLARLQGYDLGLIERPLEGRAPADFQPTVLDHDEIMLVARRDDPVLQEESIRLTGLMDRSLIWREAGSGTREVVEEAFRQAGLEPRVSITLSGVASVLEAVRQGVGIGFTSSLSLRYERELLAARSLEPPLRRPLILLAPVTASTAARTFMEFLHQHIHDGDAVG